MPDEQWIVIPKWDEFQHRDMARSTMPPWIKTYTKLLSDDDYLDLSHHLRGVLLGLWLEYARARRQLRVSTVSLSRRLGKKVSARDLSSLNDAGFILFSASKPDSKVAGEVASLEKRREELPPYPPSKGGDSQPEKEPTKPRKGKRAEPSHEELNPYVCGVNGCSIRWHSEARIAEHRENVHGITQPVAAGSVVDPLVAHLESIFDPELDQ